LNFYITYNILSVLSRFIMKKSGIYFSAFCGVKN